MNIFRLIERDHDGDAIVEKRKEEKVEKENENEIQITTHF